MKITYAVIAEEWGVWGGWERTTLGKFAVVEAAISSHKQHIRDNTSIYRSFHIEVLYEEGKDD